MAIQSEIVIPRPPGPESIDRFFRALGASFILHLAAFTFIFIYSNIQPPPAIKPKPEAYIVHLTDPGPPQKATRAPDPIKQKRVVQPEKHAVTEKTLAEPKKIIPVKKEIVEAKEKKVKTVVKKKVAAQQVKEGQVVADKIQKRKTGGTIDIRKFPYEWYLNIMESRIYGNWDTLSVNFYTDKQVYVMVYFRIGRSGDIKKVEIEKSSDVQDFDNSALKAVRQSAPFPPLPPGYMEDYLDVHFGFKVNPEG